MLVGLVAFGCAETTPPPAAPYLRLQSLQPMAQPLRATVLQPGDALAWMALVNPGPAARVEEFHFVLAQGDSEYAKGSFRGDKLINEGATESFPVPLAKTYISAAHTAVDGAKPIRLAKSYITFVDGRGMRRTEVWPAPSGTPGAR